MASRMPLTDAESRRMAAEDLYRNLLVEAGAGTGKTTLLIERILNLIRSGRARLSEIAAVTFTEKAASELVDKVRKKIEEAAASCRSDASQRALWETALADIDTAPISTIHSFAGRLLRESPFEAGLDPRFEVLEGTMAKLALEDAWDEWLPGALERDPRPVRRALRAGLSLSNVQKLAIHLHGHRDRDIERAVAPGPPDPAESFLRSWEAIQEELDRLAPRCNETDDAGFSQIRRLRSSLDRCRVLARGGDRDDLDRPLLDLKIVKNAGNKKKWRSPGDLKSVKEHFETLRRRHEDLAAAIRHEIFRALVLWLRGFIDHAVAARRAQGLLTFQDHLIECRNLLRDHPTVRERFQNRFKALLLDEFQDTDPLQVEIAFFLAERGPPRAKDWRDVELAPGKLFIVGDPKQSIYRFRRADIEIYEAVKAKLDATESITNNFRSQAAIIDWVNAAFGRIIRKPEDGGSYQSDYEPLVATIPGASPPLALDAAAGKELRLVSSASREEADRLQAQLLSLHERGTPWRQIAVLFPVSTAIELYEEALRRASIPYFLEGGHEFYRRQEVVGVLHCLDAIERPEDPTALVAALKSPILAHPDAEMVELLAEGGKLSYLAPLPSKLAGTALVRSMELLRTLSESRNRLSLPGLLARLIDGTGASAAAAMRDHGGLNALQNLRKLAASARRFETESAGSSLGEFTRWLKTLSRDDGVKEAESPAFEEKEDVVRIMSIHKAKGLQFKTVVLINLFREKKISESFVWTRDGTSERLEGKLGNQKEFSFRTLRYEEAETEEKLRQKAEVARLLYVAATRAEERLVVSRIEPTGPKKQDRYLESLRPDVETLAAADAAPRPLEARSAPPGDPAELLALRERISSRPERIVRDWRPVVAIKPSGTGEDSGESPGPTSRAGSDGALLFGRAVHSALETLSLTAAPAEIEKAALRAAVEMEIPGQAEAVAADAARALGTPVLDRARRAAERGGILRREVPFESGTEEATRFVRGAIDLVFEVEGGLVVVDYKTGRADPAALAERVEAYREQMRLYARSLERLTRRPVREAVLVFTATGAERRLTISGGG